MKIAVLGLGEAGSHFANDLAEMGVKVTGYDPNPIRKLHPAVVVKNSNSEAARSADIIFSANLSSVSVEIAEELVSVLQPHQFFCEMNTSGPAKKQKIASVLAPSGVKMIDLAIMAPVPPKGIMTPLLASGEYASAFSEKIKLLHLDLKYVENSQIGEAATRKLLRSIVYKGIAAVVCEAMEAGKAFDMEAYIRGQISSLIGGNDDLIDRFVEGSRTHAVRRMHEMEAVMEMLSPLTPNGGIMTAATRDNLKKLAGLEKKNTNIPPLGVRGRAVPYMQFRGGSSKGLFFKAEDLPADENERNKLLLLAMEGTTEGDPRQIDGLGGATSLTSKVAIVSKSKTLGADLDYLFVQVVVGKGKVSTTQTCGNILAGVLPFAIESGMIGAKAPTTSAKINIVNTGGICEVVVPTPAGKVDYTGSTKVDGVPGTASRIVCNYLDTVGATCGALLPTGNARDTIDGIEVTCIDNGMPIVMMRAGDLGLVGHETKEVLEANEPLRRQIESIRLKAGLQMHLGDVKDQTIPKMCLVSPPERGGVLNTRMFIPHVVHEAIGVLAAVSVATACVLPDTVCLGVISEQNSSPVVPPSSLSIEHPSGEFTVNLEYTFQDGAIHIKKSGVIRTARLLSKGEVFIP
ncbi:MAG: 4-oxalomesaconate tautomerase [Spirosomataceae bacterium]